MSRGRKVIDLVFRAVSIGLAAAFLIIWWRPELLPALQRAEHSIAGTAGPRSLPHSGPYSYADAVNISAPAVVSIYTNTMVPTTVPGVSDPLFKLLLQHRLPQRQRRGLGSGLIARANGYIITSNHVIDEVDDIRVALADGRVFKPEVIGTDPATDLAVLKIEADGLPVAPFAESSQIKVGDVVLAIGNAYGLTNTVTMGIVSAVGRSDLNVSALEDFIQTDAAINAGNSGGALINAAGEVVGINSSMLDQSLGAQSIGFAIPIAIASRILDQIITYGSVKRGWIGATFSDTHWWPGEQSRANGNQGARVESVNAYGPAWSVGLRPGDVILNWNGEAISSSNQLNLMIADTPPMQTVEIKVERGNVEFTTAIDVIQQPAPGRFGMLGSGSPFSDTGQRS